MGEAVRGNNCTKPTPKAEKKIDLLKDCSLVFKSALTSWVFRKPWTLTSEILSCGAHYNFGMEWSLELPFSPSALYVGKPNPRSKYQICCPYPPTVFLGGPGVYQCHVMGTLLVLVTQPQQVACCVAPALPPSFPPILPSFQEGAHHVAHCQKSSSINCEGICSEYLASPRQIVGWGTLTVPRSATTAETHVLCLLSLSIVLSKVVLTVLPQSLCLLHRAWKHVAN